MANNHHERVVRADYAYYAARMDWKDGEACKHLDKLDREMREAEDKLNDAQHALRCFQALQRDIELGM